MDALRDIFLNICFAGLGATLEPDELGPSIFASFVSQGLPRPLFPAAKFRFRT